MSFLNRASLLKSLDATIGSWLCRALGALDFAINGGKPAAAVNMEKTRRMLIIRPGGIGDMVVLLPALHLLKETFPQVEMSVVCEKRNAAVLKLAGLGERAFLYDSNPIKLLWQLRRGGYDIVVDTEQFHHFSAVLSLLSRAPVRIGFKINPRRNPLYTHLVNYAPDGPEGEQFMRLLEPLGVANICYDLEGALAGAKIETPAGVEGELNKVAEPSGFAAIHAGGSSKHKLWDLENYVKLAEILSQKRKLSFVLVGGSNDRSASAAIVAGVRKFGGEALSFAGDLDLDATAGVIRRASVFIGSDSGLAHLAIALGAPTVVLFGPSDRLKWGFQASHHEVVHGELPCAPCFIFGYHKPCRTIACMKQIKVEEVANAVEKVI